MAFIARVRRLNPQILSKNAHIFLGEGYKKVALEPLSAE